MLIHISIEFAKKVYENTKVYIGANIGTMHLTLAAKEGLGITYKDKISTELNARFPGYVGVSIGGRF